MVLFYIDESGTGFGDRRSPYFVLAATAIRATDWNEVDARITDLKQKLVPWAKPEDFEIKGRDLRRGEKLFKRKEWPERVAAFHETSQLIADLPCHILAVRADKRHLPEYIASDEQLYRLAL